MDRRLRPLPRTQVAFWRKHVGWTGLRPIATYIKARRTQATNRGHPRSRRSACFLPIPVLRSAGTKLRSYAGSKGVEILGDAPIFVALDSSDVWANRELFQLSKDGTPSAVAGVPPDYFSADGQLWGNPLYDWKAHQDTKFTWWIDRIKANLEFYDIVRLDHFRGFESYWSVPAKETTARNGKWIQCPGLELFTAIQVACPDAKLVAEDLGVITAEVNELRAATGLPGMAVLQFAFDGEADNAYLPHNYSRNTVAYSGTHDNDTSLGWYREESAKTQDHLRRYLAVSGDEIAWDLVRAAIKSSALMAIVPLQDLMSLGSQARLNTPGAPMGNWQWRYTPEQLDTLQNNSAAYLKDLLRAVRPSLSYAVKQAEMPTPLKPLAQIHWINVH